ncbi:MAG: DUF1648 domain-containing protein [Cumulibacter sp.]
MAARARPVRTYQTGQVVVLLRWATIVATAILTVFVLVRYPSMPQRVPTHFGLGGEADAYGPRWTVILLAAILSAVVALLAWVSGKPASFNYPVGVTEANAQRLYREGERMLVWTNVAVWLLYLGTVLAILQAGSGGVVVVAGLIAMGIALIVGIVRMLRA